MDIAQPSWSSIPSIKRKGGGGVDYKCRPGGGKIRNLLVGTQGISILDTNVAAHGQVKLLLPYDQQVYPQNNQRDTQQTLVWEAHCSTTQNNQKVKAIQVSNNR